MQPPARTGFHRPTLIIGVGLFALALVLGADGPLQQLLRALDTHLLHYLHALARP